MTKFVTTFVGIGTSGNPLVYGLTVGGGILTNHASTLVCEWTSRNPRFMDQEWGGGISTNPASSFIGLGTSGNPLVDNLRLGGILTNLASKIGGNFDKPRRKQEWEGGISTNFVSTFVSGGTSGIPLVYGLKVGGILRNPVSTLVCGGT